MDHGELVYGVIYDPIRDELFNASKGYCYFVNDRRMRVSKRESLSGAIVCTGFPPRQHQHLDAEFAIARAMLREADDLRRTGSAALDLAYVAAGRLDGYFEPGLQPWDMAAGCLLVREAGGTFCDFTGREGLPANGNLVAGNHVLTAAMVKVITANATPALLGR
jgi:myo-inositol-1(or 4)-monophosphatase